MNFDLLRKPIGADQTEYFLVSRENYVGNGILDCSQPPVGYARAMLIRRLGLENHRVPRVSGHLQEGRAVESAAEVEEEEKGCGFCRPIRAFEVAKPSIECILISLAY